MSLTATALKGHRAPNAGACPGDDRIDGGDGNDVLFGGDSDDRCRAAPVTITSMAATATASDRLDGAGGTDTCVNGPLIKECELP